MFELKRLTVLTAVVLFAAAALCSTAGAASEGQLFGSGQGYFHPTLKVGTEYSDNYKQAAADEQSDWKTTVSPGLFIAVPATRQTSLGIVSTQSAPGGQGVSMLRDVDYKGFQGGLMYRADIVRSHDHKDEDMTKHTAQGMLQYALPSGFALEISDAYTKSAEEYAETANTELEKFDSNLVNAILFYDYSPKLSMRVAYSNYDLDYTSGDDNGFKDRTDDQLSAYVFYKVLPKTDLFLQYDYINQDYDEAVLADRKEHHAFAGLRFAATAKISGHLKLGYGRVELDIDDNDVIEDFIGDASLKYAFSDRTSATLSAGQNFRVSDEVSYENVLHKEVGIELAHKLTEKLSISCKAAYKEDDYRVDSDDTGRKDEDTVFGAKASYAIQEWLKLGVEYRHTDRDSNEDSNDYIENWLLFTLAMAF